MNNEANVNIISKCICEFQIEALSTRSWQLFCSKVNFSILQELFHLSAYVCLSGHRWHTANVINFMEEISIYLQAKATEYEIADFRIIVGVLHAIAQLSNCRFVSFRLILDAFKSFIAIKLSILEPTSF